MEKGNAHLFKGLHYLQDSGVEINGVKFWGSPWQPWFHDWAFNLKTSTQLRSKWNLIPTDTDVLLTHGPPFGILDRTQRTGESVGCHELLLAVRRVSPKLHVFGHIHEGYGMKQVGETLFANASTCTLQYRPTNSPVVVDL
jgi:Icc-related predicted phosphoesterase